MSIAFIIFLTIIIYHSHHFILKKTKTWLKIKEVVKSIKRILRAGAADMRLQRANNGREMYQLVADENDDDELLQVVDDYEQRYPVDPPYTDGAEEEANPDRYITPPIIRPATRPDQLRLPYMDELAPLPRRTTDQPFPLQELTIVLLLHTQK